jgi:hypothetical protein
LRGAVLHGPRDVRFEERDVPKIIKPTDATIRISAASVCGSDLWPYRGIGPRVSLQRTCSGVGDSTPKSMPVQMIGGGEKHYAPEKAQYVTLGKGRQGRTRKEQETSHCHWPNGSPKERCQSSGQEMTRWQKRQPAGVLSLTLRACRRSIRTLEARFRVDLLPRSARHSS